MNGADVDWKLCEELAMRGAEGDAGARRRLVETMWPAWMALVRGSREMARLARSDDHVHDVLLRIVEKVERDDGHTLALFPSWQARHPDRTFKDWVAIVVANTVRDHLREQLGPTRAPASPDEPSVKRLFNEFTCAPVLATLGLRPPVTDAQTARQLLEFARARLPTQQCDALMQWIHGSTFAEIEEELGVEEPDGGRKLVRAAIAQLRRHFASRDDTGGG
jgi:DNA-directed RNA polymerase specialized sigma24 family protein